jgi:hypothetical protein
VWHRNDLIVLKDFFVWKIRHVIAFVNASVNGGFQSSMVHQFTSGKINDVAAGKEPKNQKNQKEGRGVSGDTAQVQDDGLTMAIIRCSEDQIGAKDKFLICIVQMVSEL